MGTIRLPQDFKEFLKLLNEHEVRYLIIGGYTVAYYGYPRATNDLDIWIENEPQNAEKLIQVLKRFGFDDKELKTNKKASGRHIDLHDVEHLP